MQRAAASIRTRARVLAVVGVVLAPVAALYMTLHSALEYAAALRSRPTALAARTWTPLTRWQCREYNEYNALCFSFVCSLFSLFFRRFF